MKPIPSLRKGTIQFFNCYSNIWTEIGETQKKKSSLTLNNICLFSILSFKSNTIKSKETTKPEGTQLTKKKSLILC